MLYTRNHHSAVGQSYFKSKLIKKKERDIRFVVTRGEAWGQGELEEGSPKVQTFRNEIKKH